MAADDSLLPYLTPRHKWEKALKMTPESKPTPGPWQQGQLLMTRSVSRWPKEEQDKQAAKERLRVFSGFSARDQGRSRTFVCECRTEADAALIAKAPEMEAERDQAIEVAATFAMENKSLRDENERLRECHKLIKRFVRHFDTLEENERFLEAFGGQVSLAIDEMKALTKETPTEEG